MKFNKHRYTKSLNNQPSTKNTHLKKTLPYIAILVISISAWSCEDIVAPYGTNEIQFGLTSIRDAHYSSANVLTGVSYVEGNNIIHYGHCWGTSANPTIEDSKTDFYELGEHDNKFFLSRMENLQSNTTYYIRPYFTTPYETIYGKSITFHTLKTGIPVISTSNPSRVDKDELICGGTLEADSGLAVIEKGILWDTNNDFTYETSHGKFESSFSLDSFSINITGLNYGTQYYLKAYAINEAGIAYGETKTVRTKDAFIDQRDGNAYAYVKIGNQIWMAENLSYLPEVQPNINSERSNSTPRFCVSDYKGNSVSEAKATNNYQTSGVIYNWEAAKIACPEGWHLPSDEDWKELEKAIGMTQEEVDKIGWRGDGHDKLLKATYGWVDEYAGANYNGTDDYGFAALPSNCTCYSGNFGAFWWTASTMEDYPDEIYIRNIHISYLGEILRAGTFSDAEVSIRCVKDVD